MGVPTISAARIYKGQLAGGPGEDNILAMEKFPYVALSKVRLPTASLDAVLR